MGVRVGEELAQMADGRDGRRSGWLVGGQLRYAQGVWLGAATRELGLDDALDAANKGLGFSSARGSGDHWIRNADDEHLVWWMEGATSVVRALTVPTFRIAVGEITVKGGNPVVSPPPVWRESLRYFRLSQTAEDLFEAHRNLFWLWSRSSTRWRRRR